MQVSRFRDPGSFLKCAARFLLLSEAENNLMLGIAGTPRFFGEDAYLATVTDGGGVVACALRTPPFKAVITAGDSAAIECLAVDLADRYPDLAQVHGPEPAVRCFADLWSKRTGVPSIQGTRLRLFEIRARPRVTPAVRGALRLATQRDLPMVVAWTAAFIADALPGDPLDPETQAAYAIAAGSLSIWDDGRPVSMAGWAGKTVRGVRVNFVYSAPEYRGRGYATACVTALTRQLLDEGRAFCCLYANRANPTATGIYERIGYRPIGDASDFILNSRKADTIR